MTIDGVRPTLEDLPVLDFGAVKLYILADLPEGGRVSYVPADVRVAETLHSAVVPVGAMLIVADGETAAAYRPLKIPKHGPLELAASPVVQVGPLRIPILVDVAVDVEAVITRGVVPGGEAMRTPVIPAGCMVAMFPPDLANNLRAAAQQAIAVLRRVQGQGDGRPVS